VKKLTSTKKLQIESTNQKLFDITEEKNAEKTSEIAKIAEEVPVNFCTECVYMNSYIK